MPQSVALRTWSRVNGGLIHSRYAGIALVKWVVSWPPPWLAVLTKNVAGLPTREPRFHRPPVASQNALNCAAAEPYLRAVRILVTRVKEAISLMGLRCVSLQNV